MQENNEVNEKGPVCTCSNLWPRTLHCRYANMSNKGKLLHPLQCERIIGLKDYLAKTDCSPKFFTGSSHEKRIWRVKMMREIKQLLVTSLVEITVSELTA